MSGWRIVFVAGAVGTVGCVGSDLAVCGVDGLICPPGDVCAPAGGRCVSQEQVSACGGRSDQDACSALGFSGTCQAGVCEVASAEPFSLRVSLPGPGSGSVTSQPAGIDCGDTCSANFPVGTQVVLTASPQSASTFAGWSGPCSGLGTCELTISAATTVGAIFLLPPPPTVNDVEPRSGAGAGGAVVITGTGFTGATAITFSGVEQPDFTVVSPTRIETTVPAGARSGTITVTGPGGSGSSQPFTVLLADVVALEGTDAPIGGCSDLVITIAQEQSLPVDVRVEVDPGTGTLHPATPTAGSSSLLHVATSPDGVMYTFHWDSTRDLPHLTTPAKIRVSAVVSNTAGSGGRSILRGVNIANGVEFGPPVQYGADITPEWWELADVNGDGHADVVLGASSPAAVRVLLGDGHGGFLSPMPVAVDALEPAGQVADLNGDGKLDLLVVASGLQSSLWTLFGSGDGTFTAGPKSELNTFNILWLKVVDVDRDGRMDVLFQDDLFGSTLHLARGRGDGTFAAPEAVGPAYFRAMPLFGDVNRDGRVDFVFAGPAEVDTYLGDGTGSFSAPVPSSAPPYPGPVVLADLDGDGKLDLVTVNASSGTLFLGNSDGTFRTGTTFLQWASLSGIAVGDVDLDGKPDFVVVGNAQRLAVLVASPDGALEGTAVLPDSVMPLYKVAITDLDSDGRPDLVLLGNGAVYTMKNITARSCQSSLVARPPTTGGFGSGVVATDLDRDGKLDLVIEYAEKTVAVLLGHGDGTFAPPTTFPASAFTDTTSGEGVRIAVGDMDRDGKPDLVLSTHHDDGGLQSTTGAVSVLFGHADGTFEPPVDVLVDAPAPLVVGNVDGDGDPDIVALGGVSVSLGRGDRTVPPFVVTPAFASCIAAADFDRDGRTDVFCTTTVGTGQLFRGGPSGLTPGGTSAYSDNFSRAVIAADVTGDGRPDLVAAVFDAPAIVVYAKNGDGAFAAPKSYPLIPERESDIAPYYGGLVAGDVNGDGRTDLAIVQDGNLVVLLGNATGFDAPVSYGGGTLAGLAVGDFDGDGRSDLAATDATHRTVVVFLSR